PYSKKLRLGSRFFTFQSLKPPPGGSRTRHPPNAGGRQEVPKSQATRFPAMSNVKKLVCVLAEVYWIPSHVKLRSVNSAGETTCPPPAGIMSESMTKVPVDV